MKRKSHISFANQLGGQEDEDNMRRRQIVILCALLFALCAVGSADCGECPECPDCPDCNPCLEPVSYSCGAPPYSGTCEEWTCGDFLTLNILDGGWSFADAVLVVHSTDALELTAAWLSEAGEYTGSYTFDLPAGDYEIEPSDLVGELFNNVPIYGAIRFSWKTCGDAYLYLESWHGRMDSNGSQNALLSQRKLCPNPVSTDSCIQSTRSGCYELPVLDGYFLRSMFYNPSDTEWQAVWIEGYGVLYIPPGGGDVPYIASALTAPEHHGINELLTVCVGYEEPFSGGQEFGDGCVIGAFEQVNLETRERISILPRPYVRFFE